jgi:hypothetical protein
MQEVRRAKKSNEIAHLDLSSKQNVGNSLMIDLSGLKSRYFPEGDFWTGQVSEYGAIYARLANGGVENISCWPTIRSQANRLGFVAPLHNFVMKSVWSLQ